MREALTDHLSMLVFLIGIATVGFVIAEVIIKTARWGMTKWLIKPITIGNDITVYNGRVEMPRKTFSEMCATIVSLTQVHTEEGPETDEDMLAGRKHRVVLEVTLNKPVTGKQAVNFINVALREGMDWNAKEYVLGLYADRVEAKSFTRVVAGLNRQVSGSEQMSVADEPAAAA